MERELRAAWGRPVGRVLDELDLAAPVAVTPLAQVHRGELDGAPVAVKLARPGLEAAVRADLMLLDALRPPLAAAFPNLDGGALLAQIRERALDELDFEHEASQQRAVARALRRTAGVEVPGGHSELATPAVVVSDFLDGPTLADGRPDDPAAVARALVAAHVDAARAGLLLCDPRPNHVVLRPDGRIGLLGTGAAVAGDRAWLRRRLALPAALRDADPAVFGAALAADGLLAEGRGAPRRPERLRAGATPRGRDPSAAVAHRLLHETLGDLLTGPARLDGAAAGGRRGPRRGARRRRPRDRHPRPARSGRRVAAARWRPADRRARRARRDRGLGRAARAGIAAPRRRLEDMTAVSPPPALGGDRVLGLLPDLKRDTLGTLERARREHGDVVCLLAGPPRMRTKSYAIFHPDGVRRVLATEADAYRKDNRFYEEIRWALGYGLLNSQDAEWLRQRRFVQPLFTRRRIACYAGTMGEEAEALLAAGWTEGRTVDLHREMSVLTLRMVGRLLFGADVERAVPVVGSAFPILGEHARNRSYNPVHAPRAWPTPANRRAERARAAVHAVCDDLIAARRANGAAGEDLLGRLIAARDGDERLSDLEVRDQVLIFLLAGHDTTAIALTFALHLLGRHPDVQARVHAEVDEVVGERTPGAEDVERLTYTTMVLKEAMRLYPPAWGFGRRTAAGDEIGGVTLPPGANVLVSPWVTHRHPEFWEAPERFDPDRFAPEREHDRHRHAYFPFGAGPRACIGQYFSMLEAVIALAVILRDFRLESRTETVPLAPRITLHPAAPVHARLSAR